LRNTGKLLDKKLSTLLKNKMALSIAQEELAETNALQPGNLQQTLSLSPLAWILAYQFPVHKVSPDYLP
jgi:hypothetical protein